MNLLSSELRSSIAAIEDLLKLDWSPRVRANWEARLADERVALKNAIAEEDEMERRLRG